MCVVVTPALARQAAAPPSAPSTTAPQPGVMTVNAWVIINLAATVLILSGLFAANILRPGSFAKAARRDLSPHPWWIWLVCAVLLLAASQTGVMIAASIPALGPQDPLAAETIPALCGYLVGLTVAGIMVWLLSASSPQSGLSVGIKGVLLGIPCFILAWPVVNAAGIGAVWVHERVVGPLPSQLAHQTLSRIVDHRDNPWAWVMAALAVVAAPVLEEVIYRGLVQSAFIRLFGRPWPAILLSSALFAAVHVASSIPWYAIVAIFVLGLGAGIAFERTRRLGVPIVMHILFNGANVAIALLTTPQ